MKATIIKKRSLASEPEIKTPNLGLDCTMIFEDKDGNKYYLPKASQYIFKLGGRRSPYGGWFQHEAHTGFTCEIEFEDFSGDKIITLVRPIEEVLKPDFTKRTIVNAKVVEISTETQILIPKFALECDAVFETEEKHEYYLLQHAEYVLKMNGRKSPVDSSFLEKVKKGAIYKMEIEYEEYSSDRIITELNIF